MWIAKLAEYLDAKALLDHLRGILSANFDELVKMKDFTSKDMSYRVMHRLLEGFAGNWDGDRTDTRIVGTLYPLMRSVDLSEVSALRARRCRCLMLWEVAGCGFEGY